MSSTLTSSSQHALIDDLAFWVPTKREPVPDQLIDAYNRGVETGRSRERDSIAKVIQKHHDQNMAKSAAFAAQVTHLLKERSYPYHKAIMRTDGLVNFEIMVIVDIDAFSSSGFLDIYELVHRLESEYATDEFNIASVFMPVSNATWNESALNADGYVYTLEESSTPPAR